MIAQHVRKYGGKASYQGEEAGKGQADRSHEVSTVKNSVGSPQSTRAPAGPPALHAQVAGITHLILG